MNKFLITTLTLSILSFSCALAQSTYASSSNILYQYDDNLQRIEMDSYEQECVLTVDGLNKVVTLKSGSGVQSFTILTEEEFHMESGIIYKYEIASDDGEVRKLEINTQKKIFTFKPKEIKAGETSRKYSFN